MIDPCTHGLIMVSTAASAIAIGFALARGAALNRMTRHALAAALACGELAWYGYRLTREGVRFPEGLPLQLCDLTLWLTVFAAITLKPEIFELAYFGGVGGGAMALLQPDLWEPFPSYPAVHYFVSHGLVVATLTGLASSETIRPRAGSMGRAFLAFNAYAAFLAVFNAVFGTNYLYLCRKPANRSILDYFGPWPLYIAAGEAVAFAVFQVLALPFGASGRGARRPAASPGS